MRSTPHPALLLAALVLAAACSSDDDDPVAAPSTTLAAPTSTAPPCEPIPVAAGTQERIDLTGAARDGWYHRYVPSLPIDGPRPVVIDLHGLAEGADVHLQMSNLAAVADREGFVLVTPQGTGAVPYWNHPQRDDGPPDIAFLTAVLDDVEADLCTDRRRVFVTGLSNGAFMTSALACEFADRIAAIAPVAGVRFGDGCAPSRPVPVLAIHGTDDRFVTFDGSPPSPPIDLALDESSASNFEDYAPQAIPDAMASWAAADGCEPDPVEEPLADDVTLVRWTGCLDGASVELVRVEGGGHAWPGSAFSAAIEQFLGRTTMSIDASALIWEFFEAHPMPA